MKTGDQVMADCRKCRYFIAFELLSEEYQERAYQQAEKRGVYRPLGWCEYYDRVVTYYRGRCRGFSPIYTPPARYPITRYLGGG